MSCSCCSLTLFSKICSLVSRLSSKQTELTLNAAKCKSSVIAVPSLSIYQNNTFVMANSDDYQTTFNDPNLI